MPLVTVHFTLACFRSISKGGAKSAEKRRPQMFAVPSGSPPEIKGGGSFRCAFPLESVGKRRRAVVFFSVRSPPRFRKAQKTAADRPSASVRSSGRSASTRRSRLSLRPVSSSRRSRVGLQGILLSPLLSDHSRASDRFAFAFSSARVQPPFLRPSAVFSSEFAVWLSFMTPPLFLQEHGRGPLFSSR